MHFRVVANPAFALPNMRFVAECAVNVSNQMISYWKSKIENGNNFAVVWPDQDMIKFTLSLISWAGFGIKIDNVFEHKEEEIHNMSLQTAVRFVSNSLITRISVPKFAYWLPIPALKRVDVAFERFEMLLNQLVIEKQKNGNTSDQNDVLSLLANSLEEGQKLTPREVISDMFIFLLAGHENTSKSSFVNLLLTVLELSCLACMNWQRTLKYNRELSKKFPQCCKIENRRMKITTI